MSRLEQSINRFGEKAFAAFEAEKKARQEKWLRIQTEAPEIASFLTEINKTFGKPKSVMVQIGGERIL